jgi:hypothetical protein
MSPRLFARRTLEKARSPRSAGTRSAASALIAARAGDPTTASSTAPASPARTWCPAAATARITADCAVLLHRITGFRPSRSESQPPAQAAAAEVEALKTYITPTCVGVAPREDTAHTPA